MMMLLAKVSVYIMWGKKQTWEEAVVWEDERKIPSLQPIRDL